MKWIIRLFFRSVRLILTPFMLLTEVLTTPKGVTRPADVQQQLDQTTAQLALYQFRACPFCLKVRREIKRLSLNIELRDAQHDKQHRAELIQHGGKVQVPCLRIKQAQGDDTWLYESDAVIKYLRAVAA
jgi:glutaredoxin